MVTDIDEWSSKKILGKPQENYAIGNINNDLSMT